MPPRALNAVRYPVRLAQHGAPCLLLSACYCRTLPALQHRAHGASHPSAERRRPMSSTSALQRGFSHKSNTLSARPQYIQLKTMYKKMGRLKMPSMRVSMNKTMQMEDFTNDIGLLPGTLVMPSGIYRLSFLFSQPRMAIQMQWDRLIKRGRDFASVVSGWRYSQQPRLKVGYWTLISTAKEMHKKMYTAMAEGDNAALKPITTDGLYDYLSARVNQRTRVPATGKPERYEWTLHRYLGRARTVSHRAGPLGSATGSDLKSAVRQVIVRIRSEQSLRRVPEDAAAAPASGDASADKDGYVWRGVHTEYFAMQKRLLNGVEEPWKIYGTVPETQMEHWEQTIRPLVPSDKEEAT